jgi:CSLREA domain-containing protein
MQFTPRFRRPQVVARPPRAFRPQLEALESRTAPAVLTVTSAADTHQPDLLTLREAIAEANTDATVGQSDTITFDPGLGRATISLTGGPLVLSDYGHAATETIDGGGRITVNGNHAGSVFTVSPGGIAVLDNLTIINGSSSEGGGIDNGYYATLTVSGCTLSGNSATQRGGGIYSGQTATLIVSNSTFTNNSATGFGGGGIYDQEGPVTITNSTFDHNSSGSQADGGGIDIIGAGTLTVSGSTFTNNSARLGGAVYGGTTLTVMGSTFANNSAVDIGGGIDGGPLTLSDSTLVGNSAMNGGGLAIGSPSTVSNCTLAGNSATAAGGGIFYVSNSSADTLTLTNVTLTNNQVNIGGQGGGLRVFPGLVVPVLHNMLIAGNLRGTSRDDVAGVLNSGSDFNLIGDGTGLSGISDGTSGNHIGSSAIPIDPRLAPLGNYGGPTQTVPLLLGSPALGAGSTAYAAATDQRGLPRVVGGAIDIGAFQTQANPLVVTTAADPGGLVGLLSLREAVNLANVLPGANTITFDPSLNYAAITLTAGELPIVNDLTIAGPGAGLITVSGNHASRVFEIAAGVTASVSGLTIANGVASDFGGGILNAGTLTLTASILSGNAVRSSSLAEGGGIGNRGMLTITDCTLSANTASVSTGIGAAGGAIWNVGTLSITGSTLSGNSASGSNGAGSAGGAIENGDGFLHDGTLTVSNCTLSGNSASSNYGASGGGIDNNGGTATVLDSTLNGNSANGIGGLVDGSGGGINNTQSGTLTVTGCALSDNSATGGNQGQGGGICNTLGTVDITRSFLGDNTAGGSRIGGAGGGLYTFGGMATLTNSVLRGNTAGSTFGSGGAVYSAMTALTVTNCTLSGNSTGGSGGGLFNGDSGTAMVTGSTFSGNSAGSGGAIESDSPLTVTDSTLNGNSAANGGGIVNAGTLNLTSSTIADNSATSFGGGIFSGSLGGGSVRNTIIAANTAPFGPDVAFGIPSQGHNLIGNGTNGSGFSPTDLVGTSANPIDPMLGPLQDNGGLTQTMALLPGSPAIDAGDNSSAPATDQRGFPRIVGSAIDIGAFELQPAGQTTHLAFQGLASVQAGMTFAITVTALDDFGQPVADYLGTVHFTLYPAGAATNYTFTAGDAGQHTFTHVLRQAGTDIITGADTASPAITGRFRLTITPAVADHIAFAVPPIVTAGVPFAATVTVEDAYGNTVTGYTGTVQFTVYEGGLVVASAAYTFTAADQGQHTFSRVVLGQAGEYVVTAGIGGSFTFTVGD